MGNRPRDQIFARPIEAFGEHGKITARGRQGESARDCKSDIEVWHLCGGLESLDRLRDEPKAGEPRNGDLQRRVLSCPEPGSSLVADEKQMKKRRQPPDAHTYTIVLRGLGWNYKYSRSPERALTVYHSMFAENSPVKPSLIHTNAVLQVCALANDMEALWGVAAKLPGAGKNAADTTTFTIILNAIRHNMVEDVDTNPTQGDWEVRSRRRDAQSQCRRIWADVVERWRKGDLIIDESLVHAMGRTLVMGNRHDIDNVLDLVEQTMAIPRQLPRKDRKFKDSDKSLIEDAERDAEEYNENAGHDGGPPLVSQESNHSSLGETPNAQEILPGTEFLPLVNPEKRVVYAVPSWKTLSLVLNACSFLEAWLPAEKYWDLLTSSEGRYRIPPDRENYVQYLRNLRQRHASKKCSSLLQEMRSRMGELPERKAFRIALSACCRDTRNPNVVENAKSIFGMMDIVSTDVDTACLSDYINVVVGATLGSWRDVARALDPVWVAIDNLENPSGFGSAGDAQRPVKPSHEGGIICDKLVNVWEQCLMKAKSEVTPDEWRSMVERRNKLQGWKQQLGGQRIPANHSRRQRSSSDEQEHYSRSRSTFKSRDRSSFQVRENDSPRSKTPYDRDQQPRARVRYH